MNSSGVSTPRERKAVDLSAGVIYSRADLRLDRIDGIVLCVVDVLQENGKKRAYNILLLMTPSVLFLCSVDFVFEEVVEIVLSVCYEVYTSISSIGPNAKILDSLKR